MRYSLSDAVQEANLALSFGEELGALTLTTFKVIDYNLSNHQYITHMSRHAHFEGDYYVFTDRADNVAALVDFIGEGYSVTTPQVMEYGLKEVLGGMFLRGSIIFISFAVIVLVTNVLSFVGWSCYRHKESIVFSRMVGASAWMIVKEHFLKGALCTCAAGVALAFMALYVGLGTLFAHSFAVVCGFSAIVLASLLALTLGGTYTKVLSLLAKEDSIEDL